MIRDIIRDAETKMANAVEYAKEEFAAIRTGRAHPAMFVKLTADYYGSPTPLQQLATFQVPDARVILITPYDPSAMTAIERSIRDSDLGVNPSNDGHSIRLAFPPLTQERRKELVKRVKHMAEEGRVAVRNARRDGRKHLDSLEKGGELSSDEVGRAGRDLDKLTHAIEADIDKALADKEQELLEV